MIYIFLSENYKKYIQKSILIISVLRQFCVPRSEIFTLIFILHVSYFTQVSRLTLVSSKDIMKFLKIIIIIISHIETNPN